MLKVGTKKENILRVNVLQGFFEIVASITLKHLEVLLPIDG